MGGPLTRPSGDRTQELTRVRLVTVSFISNAQCVTTTTFGGKERKSPESICRAPRTLFRRVFFFVAVVVSFSTCETGRVLSSGVFPCVSWPSGGNKSHKEPVFFPASSNEDRQVRRPIKSNKAFRLVLKGETRHLLEKPKRGRQTIKDLLKLLLLLISSIMFSPVFLANYRDKANRGNLILAHRI